MKAYITCPVSHTQNRLHLLPEIEKIVTDHGIKTFVFKVGGNPSEIFQRDLHQLKSSDLLIAEVSDRSHGVGIEIGLSYLLNLKRILLVKKGNSVTKLALGIPDTHLIEYLDPRDLKLKLDQALKSLVASNS